MTGGWADNRADAKKGGALAVTGRDRLVARFAAWFALLAAAGVVAALVALVVRNVVTLLFVLAAVSVAAALGWVALTRRGTIRLVAAGLAVAALVGGAVAMVIRGAIDELVVLLVAGVVFAVATRHADPLVEAAGAAVGSTSRAGREGGPPDESPIRRWEGGAVRARPGGGAARYRPVLLGPGDDLLALAREAARSADVIGMAGGDGSQAIVAQVAMEHDVAFVCVPAGTRNHLALDLGLDRDDVVGALEAFASPVERVVDLAFVNDRVFVNNVSLGVYAEIVQSEAYRDAKLETTEKMLPELLGPNATPFDLRFLGPDGRRERSAQLLLVSNNPYVLNALVGAGSRPRMDTGRLGIVAIEIKSTAQAAKFASLEAARQVQRFEGWSEWSADEFRVDSSSPVAAGIDGEAVVLEPPLRFSITPSALRVRLPPAVAGLSPAALRPSLSGSSLRELWEIATARR